MKASDLIEAVDTVVIGKSRHWLALDALCELSVLCELLRVATRAGSDEEMFAVRGLSIRMGNLIDAVNSAIGDAVDRPAAIAARVGIDLPSQEGDA